MARIKGSVFVVDDDASMRKSLMRLLKSLGVEATGFVSAEAFLEAEIESDGPSCMILDIRMPGMTGMELQEKLVMRQYSMPIIFITGHGDLPMGVQAMKQGAVDFLRKPFDEDDLREAIATALEKDKKTRADMAVHQQAEATAGQLTPREREILSFVITGMLNKQIADELEISEKTVKAHRGQVTEKLGIYSVAELVRFAATANIAPAG
jgi:FixJ family two-component response regulator